MPDTIQTPWSGRHAGKDALRSEIWTTLKEKKVNVGETVASIPNFVGADKAAALMAEQPWWKAAEIVKSNPDDPHIPLRLRALRDDKLLYMAVPRLVMDLPFVEVTAEHVLEQGGTLEEAATIDGALKYGKLVAFEEMKPMDILAVGCVAVTRIGGRTGKGAGFADIELGIMASLNLVKPTSLLVTCVHPLQVIEDNARVPMMPHDWALDYIVTTDEVIKTNNTFPKPTGLDWNAIRPDQLENIPILRRLKAEHDAKR
ncbi:MAG: 5-formyltetrahydrofolate cyclo-ligase [Anaerolineae bacterium]|nr:5-formyltetrahydrofolate cyclo-ligase [Anaerolineae bacterium]